MIKGILFDFDDTIGNRCLYTYQTFEELLDTYCTFADPYQRETVLQDLMLWDMKGNYRKNFILENLKKKYHLPLPIADFNEWWNNHQSKHTIAFDGIEEDLAALHQKYKLALCTNGTNEAQRDKVQRAHLGDYFDAIVTSGELGHKKPAPDVYVEACKQLGLETNEVIFVGDTFSTDIIGAHRLGIPAIWVIRKDWPCSLDIPRIESVHELLDIL
ncbi:HAD family hydrolase [Absicoccus porci]|mgnify:FL=1|jgi:putative hydrolase of the HAD superfamily|uniref:HAD family hydrolase n=1 Tax=Absicoccus porci TaxID=2486576 RepID=UPI001567EA2C|nr:HAD family hydrolase [Absicoccus porci]MDD6459926.1 HAD family hydrolase [Absicoccus porci]